MSKCGCGYQVTLSWIPEANGRVPKRPVEAGNGVVVIRGRHENEVIPGKLVQGEAVGHVAYGGQEFEVAEYEVLCETGIKCSDCFEWTAASGGKVPENSMAASRASDNAPLYVVRTQIGGDTVVGRVHEGHTSAYFPHCGKEILRDQYEVLVWK